MPVLHQIEIYLDNSYSEGDQKSFLFKSRCVCNYLERRLASLKFISNYSRINIYLSKDKVESVAKPMKGDIILKVEIEYLIHKISTMPEDIFLKNCVSILTKGLIVASKAMPIPIEKCFEYLADFEKNDYKNEWIQAEKTWGRGELTSIVKARLTTKQFTLHQVVLEQTVIVFSKIIVKTAPRELLFYEFLGNLSKNNKGNIIYKRKNKIITKYDIIKRIYVS